MKTKILQSTKSILTLIVLNFAFFQIFAASPKAPSNLRCFDKYDPIGTNNKPYFGWYINDSDNDEIQSAYQIIVSSNSSNIDAEMGDIWDSGKISSSIQNYVYFQGKHLNPACQYYWKVRTWDKDGNVSPYSGKATFATGLFTNNDWSGACWIKRLSNNKDDYTYFRKKIKVPNKIVKRAVVYIAACHSYELYVNEAFVGKGFNNHYPQYSYYNAWDITPFLTDNSENLLACLTHWYGGGQGRATGAQGLLVKAVIEYSDSTQTIIGTDKSWKQIQAKQWIVDQPQRNGEGVGRIEKYDSRNVIDQWNSLNYDDSEWNSAFEIGSHPIAPWTEILRPDLTRVIETEIKPVSIINLANGKYVVDLGKIYAGSFKINFSKGNSGDSISMIGGFVLNSDSTVSTRFNQQTNLNYYFIHNGKASIFNPNVYLGLRYLQINNSPNDLNFDNVSFICRHFELDSTRSSFHSSNSQLNNVWQLMFHSLMVGAQESFVDTPTREKGGFLGDAWSQAVPCLSVMCDRTMNMRILNEFLDSQDQYWPDGRLNAVYPNVDGARDIPDYTQSYLVWVWDYYMQTGNVEFLKFNYARLKKIADYIDNYKSNSTGLIHQLKGGKGQYEFGIIDWPPSMRYGYDMAVDSRTVIDVYAYANFEILSKIAGVIGITEDKEIYGNKANNIKAAINKVLINKDGVYVDGIYADGTLSEHISQHANILPFAFDLVPASYKKRVVDEIKNRKMNVGMICLRWLPESLGLANEGEHLIELYTNPEWDGWAKTIANGGTVTWESWNANETNESMSHPWGAVGLLGIQNYVLGIKPLSAQHDTIEIKPLFFGDKLTYANGVYPTDKGDVMVDWNNNNGKYILKINIPDNIVAKVCIPKCGINGSSIRFDYKETNGFENDAYVILNNVGSGLHIIERFY